MIRNDVPLSEQWRLAAEQHRRLESAARLLEEGKSAFVAQRKTALGDMSDAKADRIVKASPEYSDYIKKMCQTRDAASAAWIEVKFKEMQHREWIAADANARSERRM